MTNSKKDMPTDFEQNSPLDVYPHRMAAAHARKARKIGQGNESKGVRIAIEKFEFVESSVVLTKIEDRNKKKE